MARPRRYTCARCGRQRVASQMIYSRYTRNRYCRDMEACERIARKKGAT